MTRDVRLWPIADMSWRVARNGKFGMSARRAPVSLRLDVGRPDQTAPLLGFVSDELAELRWRTRKHRRAKISKLRFHLGIGEGSIDLSIQLVDDFGGRILGRSHAVQNARLVPRDEFVNGRQVGQCRLACLSSDCKGA
jgi:hypothetical protein